MSTKQELSVKNEPIEDIVPHNSLKKELNDESTSFLNTPQNNFKKLVIKNEPVVIKDESVTSLDMWNFNEDIEIKMENIDNKYEICDSKEKLFFKLEDNEICKNREEAHENIRKDEQNAVFTTGKINKFQEPKDASQDVSVSRHVCNICARFFMAETLLQNHLTLVHHFQDFKSSSCEIESAAKNIGSSYSNMNSVINGNKIAQRKSVCCKNGKKQFNSGRKYANNFNLTYDMQANDNERFVCDFCNMHFKMKSSLISHLKSHNGQSYQCTSCVKYFESIRGLCNHMFKKHGLYYKSVDIKREYYNNKQYKCSVCEKSYKNKYDLKKHSVIHSNNALVCHVCKNKFQSKRYLLEHMLMHTGEKKYKCDVCSKSFKRKSHLTIHSFQHGEKPYNCDKCEKPFVQKSKITQHLNICNGKECPMCRKIFLTNELLKGHLRECSRGIYKNVLCSFICVARDHIIHPIISSNNVDVAQRKLGKINKFQEPKDASQDVSVSRHVCNICARFFMAETLLQNHLTLVHHFQDFKSSSCEIESAAKNIGSSYSNMNSVINGNKIAQRKSVCCKNGKKQFNSGRKYANNFNLTYDVQANDNERFCCDFCNMHFKMKSSLISHLKSHNGQSYQCTSCVKYFESIRGLCNHMFKKHGLYYKSVDIKREYYNNKQYKCSVCEKSYKNKYDLKKHSVIHSNNALVCHVCKKKFQSKRYLLEHMLMHTGEKKYKCDVCSKSFKRKSHLTIHSFQHGEKPYNCDKCEKSFVQKSKITQHLNICNGKECPMCRKIFLTNELLKGHLRECSRGIYKNVLFSCSICCSFYSNKYYLRVHKKLHEKREILKCFECGKTFKTKHGLIGHIKIHAREEP